MDANDLRSGLKKLVVDANKSNNKALSLVIKVKLYDISKAQCDY